jgi:hypothetical protein
MVTQLETAMRDRSSNWNGGRRMYAIVFDLDANALASAYPTPHWNNAYRDIRDGRSGASAPLLLANGQRARHSDVAHRRK